VRLIKRGSYLIPEASREAVAKWRRDSDPVATWLDEATRDPEKDEGGESLGSLYVAFELWAKDRGFMRLNEITFARRLTACGVRKHSDGNRRTWLRRLRRARDVPGMEEVSVRQGCVI
jgi:phage/plasmid-associated DNA primase